jgi:hypothetical protein
MEIKEKKPTPLTMTEFAYILKNSTAPTMVERVANAERLAAEILEMRTLRANSKIVSLDDYRAANLDPVRRKNWRPQRTGLKEFALSQPPEKTAVCDRPFPLHL